MASITKQKNGTKVIQFSESDGRRRTIYLGKMGVTAAQGVKLKVEHLMAAKRSGQPLDGDTASWVATIDSALAAKLAKVELIQPRKSDGEHAVPTLRTFLKDVVARATDVEPATITVWSNTIRNLCDYFGDDRELGSITEGDAEAFLRYLRGDQKLAISTSGKRIQFARSFFEQARKFRLIDANPFAKVKAPTHHDSSREEFVTVETMERLFKVCDTKWKTIFALARYGGLRCPSEVLSLRWVDVRFADDEILVRSPKTKRYGKGQRIIPLFGVLRPFLQDAYDLASEGAVYVIEGDYPREPKGTNGWACANLGQHASRLVERAGLDAWPKLFQNLRASRETEIATEIGIKEAALWLGNSVEIAAKHYLRVSEASRLQAIGKTQTSALQNPLHDALQIALQQCDATNDKEPPTVSQPSAALGVTRDAATSRELLHRRQVEDRGLEPLTS